MDIELTYDAQALIEAFEKFPSKTRAVLRQCVKAGMRDIVVRARKHHRFVSRTGLTERIGIADDASKVTESNLSGTIWLATDVAVYLHKGTRSHRVMPRSVQALRWPIEGGFAFSKGHIVGGIRKDEYLYRAANYCRSGIQARMDRAIAKLVSEI